LEARLGQYTKSILSSVADSLKSSMGIAIKGADDISYKFETIGDKLDKKAKEIQLKLTSEMNVNGNVYRPNLFFITFKQKEVLGMEFYYGITVNRDSVALDMESNDGGKVMPAPLLSFWYFVFTGGGD
ncbi:MAG: hypothetical protein ACMUIG_10375, partial [Thermoplasmatota archaeon]